MLQRKLGPYALILLNPKQPHVVFLAYLIIHETPDSCVTWRARKENPITVITAVHTLPESATSSGPVGGQALLGLGQDILLALLADMCVLPTAGPSQTALTSSSLCF